MKAWLAMSQTTSQTAFLLLPLTMSSFDKECLTRLSTGKITLFFDRKYGMERHNVTNDNALPR